MSDTQRQMGTELFLALDKIGVTSLSDDDCCQLLAWMHHDGGSSEAAVVDWALNRDIRIAQQRLNIYGGQIPNGELIDRFNEFCKDLEQAETMPDWYECIIKKYKLKERQKHDHCA